MISDLERKRGKRGKPCWNSGPGKVEQQEEEESRYLGWKGGEKGGGVNFLSFERKRGKVATRASKGHIGQDLV